MTKSLVSAHIAVVMLNLDEYPQLLFVLEDLGRHSDNGIHNSIAVLVLRFHGFAAGVECEIARCDWPYGRPKQGHVQEAAREVRYLSPSMLICPFF